MNKNKYSFRVVPSEKQNAETENSIALSQKFSEDGKLRTTIAEQVTTLKVSKQVNNLDISNPRDLDTILSMAILNMRKKNRRGTLSDNTLQRVHYAADIIKSKYDGWSPAPFPTKEQPWRSEEERFLSAFSLRHKPTFEQQVALMERWLRSGIIPKNILKEGTDERLRTINLLTQRSIHTHLSLNNSIATVTFFQLAEHLRINTGKSGILNHLLNIGFHLSPLFTMYLYTIHPKEDQTHMEVFICGYDEFVFIDITKMVDKLKHVESHQNSEWDLVPCGIIRPVPIGIVSQRFDVTEGKAAHHLRKRTQHIIEEHSVRPTTNGV